MPLAHRRWRALHLLVAMIGLGGWLATGCAGSEHGNPTGAAGGPPPTGGGCGDGKVDPGEACDGQPHCRSCQLSPNWVCEGPARADCHSGVSIPGRELQFLSESELVKLCNWSGTITSTALGNGKNCGTTFLTWKSPDCASMAAQFLIGRNTAAGCHLTVGEFEECVTHVENDPCTIVRGGDPTCDLVKGCRYTEAGGLCGANAECASSLCCPTVTGSSTCSATPCAYGKLMDACTTDAYCGPEASCVSGRCAKVASVAAGQPCPESSWCKSNVCDKGICRGTAAQGGTCQADIDCKDGGLCCSDLYTPSKRTCGMANAACPGGVGDLCTLGAPCGAGLTCVSQLLCTRTCTKEADCGPTPRGVATHCVPTRDGQRKCFVGCATGNDCAVYPYALTGCLITKDTTGNNVNVCSGDGATASPLCVVSL